MEYLTCNWFNRWSLLELLITEGELDNVLSPRVMSWLSELEYEVLEEEADWKADKSRQFEVWLEDEFIRSLRLGDVSVRVREANVFGRLVL